MDNIFLSKLFFSLQREEYLPKTFLISSLKKCQLIYWLNKEIIYYLKIFNID